MVLKSSGRCMIVVNFPECDKFLIRISECQRCCYDDGLQSTIRRTRTDRAAWDGDVYHDRRGLRFSVSLKFKKELQLISKPNLSIKSLFSVMTTWNLIPNPCPQAEVQNGQSGSKVKNRHGSMEQANRLKQAKTENHNQPGNRQGQTQGQTQSINSSEARLSARNTHKVAKYCFTKFIWSARPFKQSTESLKVNWINPVRSLECESERDRPPCRAGNHWFLNQQVRCCRYQNCRSVWFVWIQRDFCEVQT